MIRFERSLLVLGCLCLVQAGLNAQSKVKRYDVTKETDYGIVYRLPETKVQIVISVRERTYIPGVLSSYADKYLSQKASAEPTRTYEITGSTLRILGQPDTTKQYLIVFDKKSTAPFVKLTDRGILYSINGNTDPSEESSPHHLPLGQAVEQKVADKALPSLPREYAQAGTKSKQAEIAANYLYEVRESAMNILTGSVDNMPKDGESMRLVLDRLRTEERRTQRLFLGDTTERVMTYAFIYDPTGEDARDVVIARFSELGGLVGRDDLSGAPVLLSLQATERAEPLGEKGQRKKDKQLEGSFVYNLPGEALLTLTYEGRKLASDKLPLTQLGTQQALAPKMFSLTPAQPTAVYLDTRTGAILNIRQE